MKKLIVAIAMISSLFGGTAGAGEDGKLYGKLFFDFTIQGDRFYEYASYNSRKGIHWDNSITKRLTAQQQWINDIKISAKISVPNDWNAKKIILENNNFSYYNSYVSFYTYINDKKITSVTPIVKVKKDTYGNSYIDYKIEAQMIVYKNSLTGNSHTKEVINKWGNTSIRIANAKKKRGKDYQWVPAKFYVIDE